jgi:hypothetical protein
LWELEYREKEFSLQARIAKGLPLPEWAEREPPVYPGDEFILTAFYHLSSCRQFCEGPPGPIPWHHIIHYAERAELDAENTDSLVYIIREMDTKYLNWYERKLATKTPKKGAPSHGKFRRSGQN